MDKPQIIAKLLVNHQNFADEILSMSGADFTFAPAEKWTAGQQLDHLVRSVSPVKTALTLPKFVPRLLFGTANRKSRDYETLVDKYQSKLASGGKASGHFIPPVIGFEKRGKLTEKLLTTVTALTKRVETFSEQQLDKCILPHPLLGKLTFREMLYFTIYHAEHHHRALLQNSALLEK